jgi:hypothetical protein
MLGIPKLMLLFLDIIFTFKLRGSHRVKSMNR